MTESDREKSSSNKTRSSYPSYESTLKIAEMAANIRNAPYEAIDRMRERVKRTIKSIFKLN